MGVDERGRGMGADPKAPGDEKATCVRSHVAPPDARSSRSERPDSEFIRAENEDDDGYDPYSDRLPDPEPLFERDPWD